MTEVIEFLVIIALLIERAFSARQVARERRTLLAAALSDTPGEFAMLDRAPKAKKEPINTDELDSPVGF